MKSLFTTALLFLSILSLALPRTIDVKDDASDAYVDALLANLRDYIASTPGLDPADLPEGEVSFSQEVGFITFHGSARVYDGFFRGLSTIHVCIELIEILQIKKIPPLFKAFILFLRELEELICPLMEQKFP